MCITSALGFLSLRASASACETLSLGVSSARGRTLPWVLRLRHDGAGLSCCSAGPRWGLSAPGSLSWVLCLLLWGCCSSDALRREGNSAWGEGALNEPRDRGRTSTWTPSQHWGFGLFLEAPSDVWGAEILPQKVHLCPEGGLCLESSLSALGEEGSLGTSPP